MWQDFLLKMKNQNPRKGCAPPCLMEFKTFIYAKTNPCKVLRENTSMLSIFSFKIFLTDLKG